jgi:uncharacterized HhH-GPD family protein
LHAPILPECQTAAVATIRITGDTAADGLLSKDPLALLLGMLLDQQFPMEAAFTGPWKLKERLGHLDPQRIAEMDTDELVAAMRIPPVVHRYPASMGGRVQELCRVVAEDYGGKAQSIWKNATSGDELLARLKALPGFGEQKAKIFVALLGKQLKVQPAGWQQAAGAYAQDDAKRSVADVVSPQTLLEVRAFKKAAKEAAKSAAARA